MASSKVILLPRIVAPTLGDVMYIADPTLGALGSLGIAVENLGVNQYLDYNSNTTVVNTVTETALLGAADDGSTKTITPALARVGRTFQLFFSGVMGNTGTPTLTVRLKLGGLAGTTIYTFAPVLPVAGTFSWRLNLYATITAVGAGGSITVHAGALEIDTRPDGVVRAITNNSLATAIDFSVSQDWELSLQWGTADPADTFTYRFGNIGIVR